jgi:uncharacterized protein YbjT (DUF2867 family)
MMSAQQVVAFPNINIAPVDPRDMGMVAAAILSSSDPDKHHGKFYDISGPELITFEDIITKVGCDGDLLE